MSWPLGLLNWLYGMRRGFVADEGWVVWHAPTVGRTVNRCEARIAPRGSGRSAIARRDARTVVEPDRALLYASLVRRRRRAQIVARRMLHAGPCGRSEWAGRGVETETRFRVS